MTNLTILNNTISQYNNLFSLNDLHRASGSQDKHRPTFFIRLDTTKELISEIQQQDPSATAVKSLRGTQGGTYACEELVIAYAMWISPKFHLVVLRAFLDMRRNQPKPLALPKPEPKIRLELTQSELNDLVRTWLQFTRFRESAYFLIQAYSLRQNYGQNETSLVFNHDVCKRNIADTTLLMQRLSAQLGTQPKAERKPTGYLGKF